MKPTAAELFAAYPTITHAVAWVELMICAPVPGCGPSMWNEVVAASKDPADVVGVIRELVESELASDEPTAGYRTKLGVVAAEVARPEFLMYVAGKLGSV